MVNAAIPGMTELRPRVIRLQQQGGGGGGRGRGRV